MEDFWDGLVGGKGGGLGWAGEDSRGLVKSRVDKDFEGCDAMFDCCSSVG